MGTEAQITVYYIADDYRVHFVTKDLNQFRQRLMSYSDLLSKTSKQNRYDIGNWLMPESEYEAVINNQKKLTLNHPKPHLKLVE